MFQINENTDPVDNNYIWIGFGEQERLVRFIDYAVTLFPTPIPGTRLRYELKRFK